MIFKRLLFLSARKGFPSTVQYVQGQSPAPKLREYFYYIDHEGMLFLDDARIKNFTSCFKEKKFLEFFFKRIRLNNGDRYREDFPFVSLCGRERNYIRCDDVPIVFTDIYKDSEGIERLAYAHAGDLLSVPWEPNRICMFPTSGRVYHPAPEQYGSIGLIRSRLAIELSKNFTFLNGEERPPTHFTWNSIENELDKGWWKSTYISTRRDSLE
ncbi:UPF0598 protein CG30010 isoform X2 [Toxorhynchites rutilus septentrionalis]|uniref:UPF0598 protein CG30010 isoform X2 n=1 Tax=Toxorhynchites rutilus septentrionalis TaxID=329112 RepID=UPI00247AA957|nr:UPF0598 protein CG30010 isoform X2 [Toxorhynchites rutilus septentrionalis]